MAKFTPGIRLTLFVVLLLPLLITLGFWQLNRGAEKRAMESEYLTRLTTLARRPDPAEQPADFSRLRLVGVYQSPMYLVDNQIHGGQPGYWVVQRFDDTNGASYMVNRGYVPAPELRRDLPLVPTPDDRLTVEGVVWPFTGLLPLLADESWDEVAGRPAWPLRVQRMDIARMAAHAGALPLEVRLEAGQASVFQAAPFAGVLNDEVHLGYALTWFGLAGVLVTGFVVFGLKQARVSG